MIDDRQTDRQCVCERQRERDTVYMWMTDNSQESFLFFHHVGSRD